MDEHEENFKDIFRYTDVEYTPDGYTDVYRWDDFLVIAGDHVYSAMDTIDSVSPGGKYEGFDPQYAYTCEIVGCGDLFDGCALFRPVSHDGEDYIQIGFHFYHGDEPKPVPEFFKPVKGKGGKSPAEMAAAARAAAGNGRVGVPDGIRRNRHAV